MLVHVSPGIGRPFKSGDRDTSNKINVANEFGKVYRDVFTGFRMRFKNHDKGL